jgi:cyclin-dependent kinase 7
MEAKSPAFGVPPEQPPLKRQKVLSASASMSNSPFDSPASAPSPAAPMLDLAEQMDMDERSKYIKGKKIGSGQYADVFEATLVSDRSKLFAIKKIKIAAESADVGISYDSLREIRFLQELNHPNIIKLHAVFSTKDQNLNLVLEHLPQGDLLVLVQDTARTRYTPADVKAWMMMMMRGVWFCHQNFILHRDIKPNNLLIAANGEIKLADFGLARSFADPYTEMTSQVITSWYRPPELFFRARYYGGAVDIWSCGCVFAELINRAVFLMGIPPDNELNMVRQICEKVGTPTEENWPGVTKLRSYVTPEEVIPVRSRSSWIEQFRTIGEDGVDLLIAMMQLDPNKRLTAEGVLRHKYFTSIPRPTPLGELPKKGGGVEAMGEELKRRGGEIPGEDSNGDGRGDRVARKIDFGHPTRM